MLIAIGAAACDRAHPERNDVQHVANTVEEKTDRAISKAKREAERVRDNLPSAAELRDDVNKAGDEIKLAAQKVEAKALEARQNVRAHLAKSR
jgi:ElaB/YqjD/DUF883 family membrane-anchored ribosome-binding protein